MGESLALNRPAPATSATPNIVRVAPDPGASEQEQRAFFADAVACIREHGVAIIENAMPKAVLSELLAHFHKKFPDYMRPGQSKLVRNYQYDPLRAQIPVEPIGPVATPMVYANPIMMALAREFLGEKFVVGEMGALISHPGTTAQFTHRDSTFLFGGLKPEIELPPHGLNSIIPLVDVPLERGPTEYWPGTHIRPDITPETKIPSQQTAMKLGSIFVYDGRLMHRGSPNRSDAVRPAFYIDYQRPWYIERAGYETKPQIKLKAHMLAHMAPEHRKMFEWALHLNRSDTLDEFVMRWAGRFKSHVVLPVISRIRRR